MKIHPKLATLLLCLLIAISAAGCGQRNGVEDGGANTGAATTSALPTGHADALDITGQLALGILRLEESADAVTEEQAAALLPLWEALQGTGLQGDAERLAMAQQIEATLTEAQVAAIAAMQLTQADAQTWAQAWAQEQGLAAGGGPIPGGGFGGAGRPGAGGGLGGAAGLTEEERAEMRERFQNMTEEERAEMRERFAQRRGDSAPAAGQMTAGVLARAVTALLAERSGQAPAKPPTRSLATATPDATPKAAEPTPVPTATPTPIAVVTLPPFQTPEVATATPTPTLEAGTTDAGETGAAPATTPEPAVAAAQALEQMPDTDPGPPLTVEVTRNSAEPNPNLAGSTIYKVAGFVRNPTEETYALTAVHVTFYDADGFRGAFYPFPGKGGGRGAPGGEYVRHGALEADFGCVLLAPGAACPFTAEIAAQAMAAAMAAFKVHPDAVLAEFHTAASVTLSGVQIAETGTGYARISGTVVNANAFDLKFVTLSGVLLDGSGQIVSLGKGTVTDVEAGGTARFEVYVEQQPYASYEVYAQAEQR